MSIGTPISIEECYEHLKMEATPTQGLRRRRFEARLIAGDTLQGSWRFYSVGEEFISETGWQTLFEIDEGSYRGTADFTHRHVESVFHIPYGLAEFYKDNDNKDPLSPMAMARRASDAKAKEGAKKKGASSSLNLKELEKLILPKEKIEEIVSVIKQHGNKKKIFEEWGLEEVLMYGKGMTMLFHGPPGTGKTWAANCIAKTLGKELMVVDNAQLDSPLPGEKERAVKQAFEKAQQNGKILLLDECDSLLMSRNNVGMIIGAEINALLTAIEKFEGVCVLTTNRIEELDEALQRRISLVLEFPEPNKEQRLAIWKRMIPKKMPLAKDVSLEELAELSMTGGYIKNAVLGAARHAISEEADEVQKSHFKKAIQSILNAKKSFDAPSKSPRTHGYIKVPGRSIHRAVTSQ